ncbi:hypothetical protein LCER1_G002296 [Lachnellula cervina]|uniref:Integral membrane protein n=1 Tax=Lachnellula cervina TaxID=1316786 RepID=A0A7D8Z991_9HELO|nr:hypothetical protein LCER1_G002296 [Lachnellula cervina]
MSAPYTPFTRRHDGICYGPFGFLNPTIRKLPFNTQPLETHSSEEPLQGEGDDATKHPKKANAELRAEDVDTPYSLFPKLLTAPNTSPPCHEYSQGVAIVFTLGSVVWCINAFFVWLPLQSPSTEFKDEITSAGGISAFIGATIFEFGSILLMIEAVNENRSDCFGWAVEEVLEERGLLRLRPDSCTHHHGNKKNLVGKGKALKSKAPLDTAMDPKDQPSSSSASTWIWFPTARELRTHYLKEVGFLACLSQMIGATVFWISGFTALPPIYDRLTSSAAQNGAYWAPQVIGGSGFIISGTLFMLETQRKWYLPAPRVLGWHIGAWNLIGGIGFTLCGALGFASANSGCVYQGSLATFWGSWCFLIGSVIQV